MKTPHKDYTIVTITAKVSGHEGWKLTLEVTDADQQQVSGL